MLGGGGVCKDKGEARSKSGLEAKIFGHKGNSIAAGGSQELGRWLYSGMMGQ